MSAYTDSWTGGHGEVRYFTRADGSRLRYFTEGSGPALVAPFEQRVRPDSSRWQTTGEAPASTAA